jgi:hypothetical protein
MCVALLELRRDTDGGFRMDIPHRPVYVLGSVDSPRTMEGNVHVLLERENKDRGFHRNPFWPQTQDGSKVLPQLWIHVGDKDVDNAVLVLKQDEEQQDTVACCSSPDREVLSIPLRRSASQHQRSSVVSPTHHQKMSLPF